MSVCDRWTGTDEEQNHRRRNAGITLRRNRACSPRPSPCGPTADGSAHRSYSRPLLLPGAAYPDRNRTVCDGRASRNALWRESSLLRETCAGKSGFSPRGEWGWSFRSRRDSGLDLRSSIPKQSWFPLHFCKHGLPSIFHRTQHRSADLSCLSRARGAIPFSTRPGRRTCSLSRAPSPPAKFISIKEIWS